MYTTSGNHSENHNRLGESAYDFFDDTDTESRDGNITESVASTDYNGVDDVTSLADTEHSEDESDSDGDMPAVTGLGELIENSTTSQNTANFQDEIERPLSHSIEFEEPLDLGVEIVSVKHTVCEFEGEQAARIASIISPVHPPTRLVATIRQTMTKQGLSTKDALRILYVGDDSAKRDIIHKIASSVAASVETEADDGGSPDHAQLFNVVPVSAFGSERMPEIELMQSSRYQIKVEDCSSAMNLKFEDEPGKPDVIKLIIDENYAYHSVPEKSTFIVEPKWDLPHVAIFYCSENDSLDLRRTRTFSRTFLSRHKVPSIVISHKQSYDKSSGCITLDQHTIHMCLESREVGSPRNIIHQRLPIDLASFMNIDARQMNRNLAYLTGLHEPLPLTTLVQTQRTKRQLTNIKKAPDLLEFIISLRPRTRGQWLTLLPMGLLLFGVLAGVLSRISSYHLPTHVLSINGDNKTADSIQQIPLSELPQSSATVDSSLISTEIRTSTKTITVTRAQSASSNSLAPMPTMDIGKLRERNPYLPAPRSENILEKITICDAEILGQRELLIRIPPAALTSWLGKGAMALNVSRGVKSIDTELAYSTYDGVVLQFPRRDAHGILNVSIVTFTKPKVDETFQVDFGSSWRHRIEDAYHELYSAILGDANEVDNTFHDARDRVWMIGSSLLGRSQLVSNRTYSTLLGANSLAIAVTKQLRELTGGLSLALVKQSAMFSKDLSTLVSDTKAALQRKSRILSSPDPASNILLRAQIKSRLAWLKFQGRTVEAREYERKAANAMTQRQFESRKAKTVLREERKKARKATRKNARGEICGKCAKQD